MCRWVDPLQPHVFQPDRYLSRDAPYVMWQLLQSSGVVHAEVHAHAFEETGVQKRNNRLVSPPWTLILGEATTALGGRFFFRVPFTARNSRKAGRLGVPLPRFGVLSPLRH